MPNEDQFCKINLWFCFLEHPLSPSVGFLGTLRLLKGFSANFFKILGLNLNNREYNFMHETWSFLFWLICDAFFCRIYLFNDGGLYHIETRQLICWIDQWTGFFMKDTSLMKMLTLFRRSTNPNKTTLPKICRNTSFLWPICSPYGHENIMGQRKPWLYFFFLLMSAEVPNY